MPAECDAGGLPRKSFYATIENMPPFGTEWGVAATVRLRGIGLTTEVYPTRIRAGNREAVPRSGSNVVSGGVGGISVRLNHYEPQPTTGLLPYIPTSWRHGMVASASTDLIPSHDTSL